MEKDNLQKLKEKNSDFEKPTNSPAERPALAASTSPPQGNSQNQDYSLKLKEKYPIKEGFRLRIEELLGKKDAAEFFEIAYTPTLNWIRCNTIKISPADLRKRLEKKGWKVRQPFENYEEIMVVDSWLGAGELGKTKEHLLGYYYVQDVSSMMSIIALGPTRNDVVLDLCASPGSKTTQAAAKMENAGVLIANDSSLDRLKILNANLEKCGVSNVMVLHKDGVQLCRRFKAKTKFRFNKILVDAPCSGEGTLRKSLKTFNMWNEKFILSLSKTQKKLVAEAMGILRVGGELVYSTCTLSPEEDEGVVNFLKKNFEIRVEKINLPLKTRQGVVEWKGKSFDDEIKNCCRIYPQDNDSDGFFVAKITKLSEKGCLG